ncbi:MAG: tetratricopeptide repeat protein [Planctomycetaceae bacterium]|jgi:Tfp pilus assembly protein PilF|nr:tetratricopeptide repeat protein [Planctomycetaceae bacterium]
MMRIFTFVIFILFFEIVTFADDGKIVTRIPEIKFDAEFIDPKSCVECHADICEQWKKSDHANSMNHATEKNILANFNNVTFLHIGFDDILLLTDDEIKLLINTIETSPPVFDPKKEYLPNGNYPIYRYNISGRKTITPIGINIVDLVTSVFDAKPPILNRLRQNMSAESRIEFDDELKFQRGLKFQRAGEIAIAHDRVANVLRQLIENGKIKTKCGTRFRMFHENNKFKVETDVGEFEVKFTLGFRPLQQYLAATDAGKLQVLPVAWDVNSKRWFHLYPKEQIPKDDQLHWTSPAQNWNRMCADCHTTNLQKNFNPKTKEYNTSFSEINVGCQACHGGCGKHDAVARKHKLLANWNPKIPKEVAVLSNNIGAETVRNCAFCHARRRLLQAGTKPPERHVADWFVPELIDTNTYYSDGQLMEESFEYGSFIQSKMYSKGVGCVNCHEPHSLELKFQGNRLCAQCHSPSIYDTKNHHFHSDSTKPGTRCVECHFPQSTFMVVDPRRDHSIRKPNPALTVSAGVPNACTICHRDRKKGETLEWANAKVEQWYANKRKSAVGYSDFVPVNEHYSLAIIAGKRNDPTAIQKLIKVIRNKNNNEYRSAIRAGAIAILGRILAANAVEGGELNDVLGVCREGLLDDDVWVRLAATGTFEAFDRQTRIKYLTPMLGDAVLAVRVEAARVLAGDASYFRNDNVKKLFAEVKQEYINSQYVESDQAAAYLNLAAFEYELAVPKIAEVKRWFSGTTEGLSQRNEVYLESQKTAIELIEKLTKKPFELYQQSIYIDKNFFPARINLAMLYNERGDNIAAEREFREALRIVPSDGNAAYSLGLLLAEQGKFEESIKMLKTATKNFEQTTSTLSTATIPETTLISEPAIIESTSQKSAANRAGYNLGLLLLKLKRHEEAELEFEKIIKADPQNTTFLYAIAVSYLQRGEKQKAAAIINRLITIDPKNPQWKNLKE